MVTTSTTFPGFISGAGTGSSGPGATIPSPYNGSGSIGSTFGLTSLAGSLVQLLVVVAMASLVGIVIIAVVASRAEPDPTGRRPQSVYFFVVAFVTLTTALFASALVVAAILGLTASPPTDAGHALDRLLLASALVTLVSGVFCAVHVRRGLVLARAGSGEASPSTRVGQTYVSVVAFVSVLVLLVAAVISLYVLFAILAPGTFGSFGGRSWATRVLIESVYVGALATVVVWRHGSMLDPVLRSWRRPVGAVGVPAAPPTDRQPGPVPPLDGGL